MLARGEIFDIGRRLWPGENKVQFEGKDVHL